MYKDLNDNSADSKKVVEALSDFLDSRMVLWIAYVESPGEFRIAYGRDHVWSLQKEGCTDDVLEDVRKRLWAIKDDMEESLQSLMNLN